MRRCRSWSRPGGHSDPETGSRRIWGSACRWRPRSAGSWTCGGSPAARPLLGRGGSGTGRSRAGIGAGRARGGEVAALDGRAHLGRGKGRLGVEFRRLDARAGPALDPEGEGACRRRLARPRAPPGAGAVAGRADRGAGRVAAVRPAGVGKSRCGLCYPALPSPVPRCAESETLPRSGRLWWTCGVGSLIQSACALKTDKDSPYSSHCNYWEISTFWQTTTT